MVIQYKVIGPEIIYMQTPKTDSAYTCICVCVYITIIIKEKEATNLRVGACRRSWREITWEGLEGRTGREKVIYFNYNV